MIKKKISTYEELLEFDAGLANNLSIAGLPENCQFEILLTSYQWKQITSGLLQFVPNRMMRDTITQLTWISPITNISYKLVRLANKYKQA